MGGASIIEGLHKGYIGTSGDPMRVVPGFSKVPTW